MSDKIREVFERRWQGHLNLDRTTADDRYLNEAVELAFVCFKEGADLAQQPAQAVPDGFLLVTPEHAEQHATTAWECPPLSRVVLVSTLKRLHTKNTSAQETVACCPYCGGSSVRCDQSFPHPRAAPAEQPDTVKVPRELLEWATDRWHAEVASRPLNNVHRRTLDTTWRQMIRRLGGDDTDLCGPRHDALLGKEGES